MSNRGAWLADLAWPEVERRLAEGAVAVLPVGAAAKQHGRHLPMASDWVQAQWLAQRLVEQSPVLVWPTLGYGFYPAFTDYPGSVSIPAAAFQQTAAAVLQAMAAAGARRALILNTGLSTIAPLRLAAAGAPGPLAVTLANIYEGPRYRDAEARLCRQARGGHADEGETAILLALAPGLVHMSRAAPWTPEAQAAPGPLSRDPAQPGYSPDGVLGDPTLADAELGRQLLAAIEADLLAALSAPGA